MNLLAAVSLLARADNVSSGEAAFWIGLLVVIAIIAAAAVALYRGALWIGAALGVLALIAGVLLL